MPDPAVPAPAISAERNLDGTLDFHELSFLEDGGEVTVGRADLGSFVILPADGAELLRRLAWGMSCEEAARWYAGTFGETVDIADFVAELDALGFVRHGPDNIAPPSAVHWTRLGRAVFSPAGGVFLGALLVTAGAMMIHDPALRPTYHHIFFTQYISVVMLVLFLGQMPLILVHEMAHMLAGRRLGLPSRLSVGRRLYFLVFQTTLTSLVGVPRRKRYMPILAGMLADLGVFSALTAIAAALQQPGGMFPLAARIALGLAYMTLLRLAWQTWFFLETDIYYLIVTILGCVDLHATAQQMLRNRFNRLRGKRARYDTQGWHPRDQAVARWYSLLMLAGYVFALAIWVIAVIPAASHIFSVVLSRLASNDTQSTRGILDSIVFLVLSVGEVLLVAGLLIRDRRKGRKVI